MQKQATIKSEYVNTNSLSNLNNENKQLPMTSEFIKRNNSRKGTYVKKSTLKESPTKSVNDFFKKAIHLEDFGDEVRINKKSKSRVNFDSSLPPIPATPNLGNPINRVSSNNDSPLHLKNIENNTNIMVEEEVNSIFEGYFTTRNLESPGVLYDKFMTEEKTSRNNVKRQQTDVFKKKNQPAIRQ